AASQACGNTRVETGLAPSQTAEQLWVVVVLGRARLQPRLILGGAALQCVRENSFSHSLVEPSTGECSPGGATEVLTSALRQWLVLNAAALLICDSHDLTSHTALSDGVATVSP